MDLLIELFSEEIPARLQARAREDLKSLVTNGLVAAGLTYASAGAFSTPRRLVLSVDGLTAESGSDQDPRFFAPDEPPHPTGATAAPLLLLADPKSRKEACTIAALYLESCIRELVERRVPL